MENSGEGYSLHGKDIFWSDINENYALLETVDITESSGDSNTGLSEKTAETTAEDELQKALLTITELKRENATLQNHVLKLENSRSSG